MIKTENQNSVLLWMSVKIGKDCNFFMFFGPIYLEHIGVLVPYFCYGISTLSTLLEISLLLKSVVKAFSKQSIHGKILELRTL
jgi:hypothetical protein